MSEILSDISAPFKILIIILVVACAHMAVIIVRRIGQKMMRVRFHASISKVRTIVSLATSVAVFLIYFGSFGLVLKEFGISLKAYLASASVVGLAIGFGSQGLVQDVVAGLTLIFTDLVNLGDMVEISGQTGIIRRMGMRFTILENHFGAKVSIPNRTITSVITYPKRYIRCIVDANLSSDPAAADQMETTIRSIILSMYERLAGIFLSPPSIEPRITTKSGQTFLRIKFRIWPGRGGPLETTLKPEIVQTLKSLDPSYADWMVSVNYEIEQKQLGF
jgi:small conductance mechanosensitive channel